MTESSLSPARVLLIEDEAILRMGLEDQLREMGHQIVGHADNASDAVCLAEELRPDLVLVRGTASRRLIRSMSAGNCRSSI